jgi:nuclear pore complex protein Nup160
MRYFLDKACIWGNTTDEECAQVVDTLGENFRIVTPRLYEDLFELISATRILQGREPRVPFTSFGRKLVLRAVQETAELHLQIFLSQLVLLVHMEFDHEEGEDPSLALHARFDVGLVYRQMVQALRRLEHIRWMVKTEMAVSTSKLERSTSASGGSSPTTSAKRGGAEEAQLITVFEGVLSHLLGVADMDNLELLSSITDVIINICAPDGDIELVPAMQQCYLLKLDRPDLALQLSRFCQRDPFPTYVQARVFLTLNDFETAALYFKRAAVGLSESLRQTKDA